jgi:predicted Zn-ribbon and HTH transcriptional regulator
MEPKETTEKILELLKESEAPLNANQITKTLCISHYLNTVSKLSRLLREGKIKGMQAGNQYVYFINEPKVMAK